jgi:uncharacterized membrane protein YqaE (UPF0057 family)
MCGSDIFLGLVAIIFPPLAVWVKRGICSADSLINIALCSKPYLAAQHLSVTFLITLKIVLGFLPGLFHAWYIIAISPDPTYEQVNDEEQGNVTYYYVQGQPQYAPGGQRPRQQGYGTVGNNRPDAQFPGQQNGFVGPSAPTPAESSRPSTDVPPTYAQAVQGDHKVQRS